MQAVTALVVLGLLARPALVPQPKELEEIGAKLALPEEIAIGLSAGLARDGDARFAACQLIDELKRYGIVAKLVVGKPSGKWWVFMGWRMRVG
ncbi:MAG: hypothetical protein H5T86_13360 [Armatimonadetes bacterium]|nr:hypothetical protein [Armatimonadota bacterium]